MVLQVRADWREVEFHQNAKGFENGAVADATELQDMRRLDSAVNGDREHCALCHTGNAVPGVEDDFLACVHNVNVASVLKLYTGGDQLLPLFLR